MSKKRNDRKELRHKEALERQAEYDRLTVEGKLRRIDERLGEGVGATKERARLKKIADSANEKTK